MTWMQFINSLQIVLAYTAMPFLIQWLTQSDFTGSELALWISSIAYFGGFCFMFVCVAYFIKKDEKV